MQRRHSHPIIPIQSLLSSRRQIQLQKAVAQSCFRIQTPKSDHSNTFDHSLLAFSLVCSAAPKHWSIPHPCKDHTSATSVYPQCFCEFSIQFPLKSTQKDLFLKKKKGKWKNKNKNSRILNLWNYHSKNPWIGCPFFTGTSASKDQIWHEIWSGGIRSKSCLSSPCYLRSALDVQCALCALCNGGQLHTTCTSVLRA